MPKNKIFTVQNLQEIEQFRRYCNWDVKEMCKKLTKLSHSGTAMLL